jgi:hypothetical protein
MAFDYERPAAPAIPILEDIWAYWKMEEESGWRNDETDQGDSALQRDLKDAWWTYEDFLISTSWAHATNAVPTEFWRKYSYRETQYGPWIDLTFAEVHWSGSWPDGPYTDVLSAEDVQTLNDHAYDGRMYCAVKKTVGGSYLYYNLTVFGSWRQLEWLEIEVKFDRYYTNYSQSMLPHGRVTGSYYTDYSDHIYRDTGKVGYAVAMGPDYTGMLCLTSNDEGPPLEFWDEGAYEYRTAPFSTAFWVKATPEDVYAGDDPMTVCFGGLEFYAEFDYETGKMGFPIYTDGENDWLDTPYIYDADTWYHIAITWDYSIMRLYVNGEVIGTLEGDPLLWDTYNLYAENWCGDCIGWIDEWGIWMRCLSQADITYLYNGGAGRTLY